MKILRTVFYLSAFSTVIACEKPVSPDQCIGTEETATSDWFQTLIAEHGGTNDYLRSTAYITTAEYKNKRILITKNCCANCFWVVSVYSCTGERLGLLSSVGDNIHPDDIKNEEIIWKPENSICSF